MSALDDARVLVVGREPWLDAVTGALETRTDASARVVETAADVLDAVDREAVDCVLAGYRLDGTTGVELARRLRERTATLPVLLVTAAGSEAVASEAIGAGVIDYVAVSEPVETGAVVERAERAVRAARRTATRRERARQFDAVFHDSQTATWVLDPDGSLARVNHTARGMIDADADAVVGEPFWTLPWWSRDGTRRDVRRLVERAREGTFGSAVVAGPPSGEGPVVELSVRPVEDARGELVSIVVEGIDITEQVDLERDLRRSEQLHRVTLNNMTDTVLITDDDGAYTYVCPNVHFVFGYSADQIRAQGTIDELLGEELYDPAELAEEGVLRNIETTATDRAGREHTLLVNVREVSIQDGTVLYSCRDVTKRKQREEALATLQDTAREFLYAETHQEIARRVVEDVSDVLDLPAGAVYRFDADANELQPLASSAAMTELAGPLRPVHPDGETLPGHCFVSDETLVFEDVHAADRLANPATELRSAIYIPLGDHGVFVAGSDRPGAFDGITQELADLLAATAEAAADRVTRESRLREQDRQLQRRNEQLSALNGINTTIREIDRVAVQAETREEVTHAVCERLADSDTVAFAWIGGVDAAGGAVEPRAWAGDEQGYLDARPFEVAESGVEPAGRTAATGEVTAVPAVASGLREEPWRSDALTRDFLSVLSIPLVYNGLTHGVLTVYAGTSEAFDGTTRAVLTELGDTIAAALSAIERKRALLSSSVTRLELGVEGGAFPLSRLARAADCTLTYRGGVQQTTDGNRVFVSVADAPAETVAEAAAGMAVVDGVSEISADGAEGGVLQLQLSEPFLAVELADHGVVVREATADPEGAALVVDVPASTDARDVTRLLRGTFSTVTVRRKRGLDTPAESTLHAEFLEALTDRQLEVLQTAYYSGFFESPREHTGEAVAEALDISPAAFYQHVRAVQRKLFTALFEGNDPPSAAPTVQ